MLVARPTVNSAAATLAARTADEPVATDRPGPPGVTIARLDVRFWDDENTIGSHPQQVDVRAIGPLGASDGYATLASALADLGRLTAIDDGMAAVLHVGPRWFGLSAMASMPGHLTPFATQLETTGASGVVRAAKEWRAPGVAAVVDGSWTHRFHTSPSERTG